MLAATEKCAAAVTSRSAAFSPRARTLVLGLATAAIVVTSHRDARAQCVLQTATACSMGSCSAVVYNNAMPIAAALCYVTAMTSASCAPATFAIGIYGTKAFYGMATMATAPHCAWNCCGSSKFIDMTVGDGLPVELMDFSVDDGPSGDSPAGEGEKSAEPGLVSHTGSGASGS